MKNKNYDNLIVQSVAILIMLIPINISITCTIGRFKHPGYTETQLFLHILKFFVWNFK